MIRNTVQRTSVLKAVQMLYHPNADEVYKAVREQLPSVSRATVYRVLGSLSHDGVIRRVEVANAPDRFDWNMADHGHFICESCGAILDIPVETSSYTTIKDCTIHKTELIIKGLCSTCCRAKQELAHS